MSEHLFEGKNIVIIGDSISDAVRSALYGIGATFIVISDKPGDYKDIEIEKKYLLSDIQDTTKQIKDDYSTLDAIYCGSDQYVMTKALICEAFDIPYIDVKDVPGVVEKSIMKNKLINKYPSITSKFRIINSSTDIDEFCKEANFPLILKPSSLDTSRLIQKVNNIDETKAAYSKIADHIDRLYKTMSHGLDSEIILEEYLEGKKYSVEGIVDRNGTVVFPDTVTDLLFGYDIGRNDPSNISRIVPSSEPKNIQESMFKTTRQAVDALDIKSSTIHAELILLADGTSKIIEVAARIGGFREKMYFNSFGYSLIKSDILMQMGEPVELIATKNLLTCAIRIYAEKEGVLKEIIGLDSVKDMESIDSITQKNNIGDMVGPAKSGHKEVIQIVLSSEDDGSVRRDHDRIIETVLAVT